MSKKNPPKVSDKDTQKAIDLIYDEINSLIRATNKESGYENRAEGEGKSGDTRVFQDTESDKFYIEGRTQDGWGKTRLYLKGEALEYVTGGGAVDWSVDQGGSPVINTGNYTLYTDSAAVNAMGTKGNSNALNHDRYSNSDAVSAMGTKGDSNALNHDKYTNANAVSAMGTKGDSNALNHDKYTDSDAVDAMGTKGNSNALNHDKYTDSDAVDAMGTKGNSNALNHDRYSHPTSDGNKHLPSGGSTGQYVKHNGSGTGQWADLPVTGGANTLSDDSLPTTSGNVGIFKELSTQQLKLYSLKAGSNITLDKNNGGGEADTYIEISASGTTVSDSNWTGVPLTVGNGGTGVDSVSDLKTIVLGLGSAAYTDSTAYAPSSHSHNYDNYNYWTISADVGSSNVSSGSYMAIQGSAPISTSESSRVVTVSLDADGVTDTHLAYNTGQHLTTSSTPTFGGATLSGELNFSSSTGSILINHEVSEADAWFFRENATNWGLYWKNANANHKTFGGYTSVGAEFVGMKHGSATNAVHINSGWGGTDSDTYATWMLSNYSGVFWCASHIYSEADVYAYYSSDPLLKENKVLIENPLDKISKLGGYTFDWKESAKEHGGHLTGHDYGVMADEVEELFPEMVQTREDGIRAVKYEKLIPVLIEAVKELKGELDAIKHST